MSYPFVASRYDYGARKGPIKAFVVHMAEGAGTVGYLARSPLRGVSVHYVIETSGRIVQMLPESHASGSLSPTVRQDNDADGFFGATVAKAVMGSWWTDPNSAVISLEIEGFAVAGPNAAQAASLIHLVNDVRSRFPTMGVLGHRDFQNEKACPGRHIDWPSLGGHGPARAIPQEIDMAQFNVFVPPKVLTVPKDTVLFDNEALASSPTNVIVDTAPLPRSLPAIGSRVDGTVYVAYKPAGATVEHSYLVKKGVGTLTDAPKDTTPFSQADVDAKIAADRAKARIVYG